MTRNVLIGVAGGTASGKTTIAENLAEQIGPEHVAVIRLDDYYRPLAGDMAARRLTNFDHPEAFEWPLVEHQVAELVSGRSVQAPRYDHAASQRGAETTAIEPRPFLVVEGILALWSEALREAMDIKIFVDVPSELRLARRLRRDIRDRGRTTDSVLEQFETTVQPMHEAFCEPTRACADLIIPHGATNRVAVEMVLFRLKGLVDPDERRRFLAS